MSARLGRLWSVAIPALLVAFTLQKVGSHFVPTFFAEIDRGYSLFRYLLSASFCNELWFFSAGPPIDLPVWSMAYEFWYYVLFGIAMLCKPGYGRNAALLIVAGLIGPKMLALFPIWIFGVIAWRIAPIARACRWQSGLLIVVSIIWITGLLMLHPQWPGPIGRAPMYLSGAWLSDGLLGLGIAALIVGVDASFHQRQTSPFPENAIKAGAGVSFSLYLLHFPLMVFCAGVLPYNHSNPLQAALVLCLIFAFVYFFGVIFEPLRRPCARALEVIARGVIARIGAVRPSLPQAARIGAELPTQD
jgi:peptidoglycan/LPS O-acetylase OafA/YrhL